MKRIRILCVGIVGMCLVLASGSVGQEAPRAPGEEIAGLSFVSTGRVRFEDPDDPALSGRVGMQEVGLMTPLGEYALGAASLAAGVWAGWTRLDFGGHPELDTEDLYGLALFLAASRPSETGWSWTVLCMPGYFTDLRDGRTGDGKLLVHAAAEYPLSSRLRLDMGVAYDTAFGEPRAYPVGGVIWRMTDAVTARLVLPAPLLHWAPTKDLGLFAIAQPAGDRWIVTDDKAGEQVFVIESWRAGVGAERRIWKSVWLRAAGGLDFARRYEARSGDRTLLDEDVDDTWYISAALLLY